MSEFVNNNQGESYTELTIKIVRVNATTIKVIGTAINPATQGKVIKIYDITVGDLAIYGIFFSVRGKTTNSSYPVIAKAGNFEWYAATP